MTIGSTANIAFALETMRTWQHGKRMGLGPEHRLALLLLGDHLASGAGMVDAGKLHHLLGAGDPADARSAISWLARCGLIRLSKWQDDGYLAFAGTAIATEQEIANARRHLGCDWPFYNWAGDT